MNYSSYPSIIQEPKALANRTVTSCASRPAVQRSCPNPDPDTRYAPRRSGCHNISGTAARFRTKRNRWMAITLLLADDHRIVRQGLRALLNAVPDFELAGEASDGPAALH